MSPKARRTSLGAHAQAGSSGVEQHTPKAKGPPHAKGASKAPTFHGLKPFHPKLNREKHLVLVDDKTGQLLALELPPGLPSRAAEKLQILRPATSASERADHYTPFNLYATRVKEGLQIVAREAPLFKKVWGIDVPSLKPIVISGGNRERSLALLIFAERLEKVQDSLDDQVVRIATARGKAFDATYEPSYRATSSSSYAPKSENFGYDNGYSRSSPRMIYSKDPRYNGGF